MHALLDAASHGEAEVILATEARTDAFTAAVEVRGEEIQAVALRGGDDAARRCAEEAIWGAHLPAGFNRGRWEADDVSARARAAVERATPAGAVALQVAVDPTPRRQ